VSLHRSICVRFVSVFFHFYHPICLSLASFLNSYSTATNCWLITCLFFLLCAVCANFISFSYSALFCAGQPSWNMPGMSFFLLQQLIAFFIRPFHIILLPLLISQYFICFFFSFLLICCHCISRSGLFFFLLLLLLLLLLSRPYLTSFCIHPRICPCVAVPFLFSLNVLLCRLCFPIIV